MRRRSRVRVAVVAVFRWHVDRVFEVIEIRICARRLRYCLGVKGAVRRVAVRKLFATDVMLCSRQSPTLSSHPGFSTLQLSLNIGKHLSGRQL